MKDEQKQPTSSAEPKKSELTSEKVTKLKTLDLGGAQGFTCDAETGICGPIDQGKEENK